MISVWHEQPPHCTVCKFSPSNGILMKVSAKDIIQAMKLNDFLVFVNRYLSVLMFAIRIFRFDYGRDAYKSVSNACGHDIAGNEKFGHVV